TWSTSASPQTNCTRTSTSAGAWSTGTTKSRIAFSQAKAETRWELVLLAIAPHCPAEERTARRLQHARYLPQFGPGKTSVKRPIMRDVDAVIGKNGEPIYARLQLKPGPPHKPGPGTFYAPLKDIRRPPRPSTLLKPGT
ncbi:hypothetical protein MTO96_029442, partial [Rhipicephalus appendiculatus]